MESSNRSFYKLFQFFIRNLINNTIILKKDTDDKLIKIYENKLYDFFFNNEILEDISLRKLIKSLEKIKEIRKINLDNNDEKSKNISFLSKFQKNVNKLDKIIELKENYLIEKDKKIIKIKTNKLELKDKKPKILNGSLSSKKVQIIDIVPKVQINNNEILPNKISINTENNDKKIENSFENMLVKSKNCINFEVKRKKNSNNIMICLIENYDYENLEKEIRSFIHEMFNGIKTMNFNDLISQIINSKNVKIFCGLEIGPFNAYFQINLSEKSNSFLVSFKIQHLDFLKETNYIILLRDLEQLSKFIINKNDIKTIPSNRRNLIECVSSKNNFEELKTNNFNENNNAEKELSLHNKNENSISEISKKKVFSNLESPSKIKDNDYWSNENSSRIFTDLFKKSNDPAIPALVHDFKNLSYDFISLINIINDKLPENNRIQLKDELDDIFVLKTYMLGLIKMINDYSEGNGFLINSNPSEIDIIETINLMIRIFNKRLETDNRLKGENQIKKNLIIHSKIHQIENSLHKKLIYNKDLILSLLYNIISNSFKSTQSGEILLELKTENLNNQNCIVLYISDTGPGIPEHIFNTWGKPFNKESKDKNSSGLGQFIINSIASSLGVYIPKPESKINIGTTFKIFFTMNNNNFNNKSFKMINEINNTTNSFKSKITVNLNNYNFDKKFYDQNIEKTIIYILLCDDSQFILNNIELFLKKNLVHNDFEFVIKKSSNFFEFLNEVNHLLFNGQFFHFFILDYNIDYNINGIKLAKCVIDVYKYSKPDFNEHKINIFYLTEENDFYENNKNNLFVKSDQVFNKLSLSKLLEKVYDKLSNNIYV